MLKLAPGPAAIGREDYDNVDVVEPDPAAVEVAQPHPRLCSTWPQLRFPFSSTNPEIKRPLQIKRSTATHLSRSLKHMIVALLDKTSIQGTKRLRDHFSMAEAFDLDLNWRSEDPSSSSSLQSICLKRLTTPLWSSVIKLNTMCRELWRQREMMRWSSSSTHLSCFQENFEFPRGLENGTGYVNFLVQMMWLVRFTPQSSHSCDCLKALTCGPGSGKHTLLLWVHLLYKGALGARYLCSS
ncbi:hypothetical protein NL676_033200 [Syzygium grande]|nr:hypothetical protein NL676_033200 [Syzygium grande]